MRQVALKLCVGNALPKPKRVRSGASSGAVADRRGNEVLQDA